MLNSISVQNFRKHADLTVEFTPGINTIRAANEAGKTTLLEAIGYAYFGAAALKESVDDVVTYGMPASKLRVEHSFSLAGVDYKIVRTPKAAELTFGRETVTGQKEVTAFVERLFGASQKMAAKLMMARQKDLGGALSGGATEAGKMIETLANLDLIEELCGAVGEKLPSGHTGAVEGMIEAMRAAAAPDDLPDVEPLKAAWGEARAAHAAAVTAHSTKKAELDDLDIEAARQILTDERVLQSAATTAMASIAQFKGMLEAPVTEAPAPEKIAALRDQVEQEKQLVVANKLHAELKAAAITDDWDQPMAALEAEIEATVARTEALKAERDSLRTLAENLTTERVNLGNRYDMERLRIEAKLITETTCALCQKDLKDVPEVARINSPLSAQLVAMEADYAVAEKKVSAKRLEVAEAIPAVADALAEAQAYLRDLQAVLARNAKVELLYARAGAFVELDRSTVPALWTWTGPTGEAKGLAAELAGLEQKAALAQRETAQRETWTKQLAAAQVDLIAAQETLAELQIKDAIETLELEKTCKVQVQALLEAAQYSERTVTAARNTYENAAARIEQIKLDAEKAKAALAKAEADLVEMRANNALIKKLRAARPVITDQLWAIVLAAVSTYAADVRGEPSHMTRENGEFRVNKRPVAGLSGSAEDALGLAIRFSLTKTFLSNVDFVILDEVAAACDDQRETAMLGLLATSGFAQTILVTHSPLADAFSDNIITL